MQGLLALILGILRINRLTHVPYALLKYDVEVAQAKPNMVRNVAELLLFYHSESLKNATKKTCGSCKERAPEWTIQYHIRPSSGHPGRISRVLYIRYRRVHVIVRPRIASHKGVVSHTIRALYNLVASLL